MHGVGVHADQSKERADGALNAFPQQLGFSVPTEAWSGEGLQDGHGDAGVASRGVDDEVRRVAQHLNARAVLSPLSQAILPQFRLLGGELVLTQPFAASVVYVDPGSEIRGAQFGEGEQFVGDIALGIDDDRRYLIDGRLFEKVNAQSGLAAAGHAYAEGVGCEVASVVHQEPVQQLVVGHIVLFAQVERTEFLEVHCAPPDTT